MVAPIVDHLAGQSYLSVLQASGFCRFVATPKGYVQSVFEPLTVEVRFEHDLFLYVVNGEVVKNLKLSIRYKMNCYI